MRNLLLAALCLAAACHGPEKVSEGRATVDVHPEYAKFRPVAIVVPAVNVPRSDMKEVLRREVYDRLIPKHYSPLDLRVVDQRIRITGKFDPTDIDWDATLSIDITTWEPVGGGTHFAATGRALLVHKSGEQLWEVRITRWPFEVHTRPDSDGQKEAVQQLAALIIDRLPERPPLPKE